MPPESRIKINENIDYQLSSQFDVLLTCSQPPHLPEHMLDYIFHHSHEHPTRYGFGHKL